MNKEYSTILVLVLAFVALYIFLDKIIFLYISLGTGVVSLLLPWIAKNIHFLWMKFSVLLGSVSAVVILNADFFCDHCSPVVYRKAYRQEIYHLEKGKKQLF